MSKVAVILAGCGVFDGSEIYETVITLQRLAEQGIEYQCMAPNVDQLHVINHATHEVEHEQSRNVLTEAGRLARGDIIDLADANAGDYDAVIIPGGFGAAKNLCDFAVVGADCQVRPELAQFITAIREQHKPVGMICIAPVMAPRLFGPGVTCTIGNDPETAAAISKMGGHHRNCPVDDIVIDEQARLVTTPAYMLAQSIPEAASGITKLVDTVIHMIG